MLEGIKTLKANPELTGQAELIEHIQYSQNGQELSLLLPWAPNDDRTGRKKCPLILFVQGSAWTSPNLGYEIPMLSRYAEEGFVVATIYHRSRLDGYPAPAFLEDAKCALRFLRAHAELYAIDKERVCAFGTSSGGNTVCLLGLTGDDPKYRNGEYESESDGVSCVVSCFAPTDLVVLFQESFSHLDDVPEAKEFVSTLFGTTDLALLPEAAKAISPVYLVEEGKTYPPFLLLHGTGDGVVPYTEMENFYTILKAHGTEVQAYYIEGAEHEGNFWSPALRDIIHEEIYRQLVEGK